MSNKIADNRVEGKTCVDCGATISRIEVSDYRSESEIQKRPLREDEKTILWCACNHPGDCIIGGLF